MCMIMLDGVSQQSHSSGSGLWRTMNTCDWSMIILKWTLVTHTFDTFKYGKIPLRKTIKAFSELGLIMSVDHFRMFYFPICNHCCRTMPWRELGWLHHFQPLMVTQRSIIKQIPSKDQWDRIHDHFLDLPSPFCINVNNKYILEN